jgi:hypothetical protein
MANIWDKLEQQAFQPSKKEELPTGSIWDSLEAQALGYKDPNKNNPGFISDIKRGGGQVISSIGSTLQDIGPKETGQAIEEYGNKIVRRNPSAINTVEEAIKNPFTTAREAVGEVVPQIGVSALAGLGGRVIGGILGAPAGPVGVAVGQTIGGAGAAYLTNLAQEYGGIRSEQRETGVNDIGRALMTGSAAAALDTAFGAERITNKVIGKGSSILQREAGTSLLKNVAKQGAIGLAEEAGTEVAQTALERYGAYKELTGAEALNEYGLSAIKGGIGGGVVRSGFASIAGERRPENSLLGGSTETNQNATTPDANAIQSAINVNQGAGLDTQSLINQTVGVVDRQKKEQEALTKQRQADIIAAMNEPTGKKITDANGIERDETAYDVAQRQAGVSSQQVADVNAQANQQAAQQQTAEQQAQQEASRKLILDKFGTTPVFNEQGAQIGIKFNGNMYFSGMTGKLNEAVDKILIEEAAKPELTHHVEFAWLDAFKNQNSDKTITPKSLSGKVEPYLTGTTSIEDVLDRVKAEIKDLESKKGKTVTAQLGFLENFRDNLIGEENGIQTKQQVPSGVGNVPVEGRAAETGTGDLGLLQSNGIRPIGTGSDNGVQNGQQNVGGGEAVSRDYAGGAIASTVSNAQETGQVNEQPVQKATIVTPSQTSTQGRQQGGEGQVNTNIATAEERTLAEKVIDDVMAEVIVRAGRMSTASAIKKRKFIVAYLGGVKNEDVLRDIVRYYDITIDQAKQWNKEAKTFLEDNTLPLKRALNDVSIKYNLLPDDVLAMLVKERAQDEIESAPEGSVADNNIEDENALETRDLDTAAIETERNDTFGGELDQKDLNDAEGGMRTRQGRTSESIQERYNKTETINAKYLRLVDKLEEEQLKDEPNQEVIDGLEADLAKLLSDIAPKKGETNAVQKQSTNEGNVQKPAGAGEKVGEGNAKPESTSREVVEVKAKEKVEKPKKQKPKTEAEKRAEKSGAVTTVYKAPTETDAQLWNALGAPIKFDDLSPTGKADWALAVKENKGNLITANKIFEAEPKTETKNVIVYEKGAFIKGNTKNDPAKAAVYFTEIVPSNNLYESFYEDFPQFPKGSMDGSIFVHSFIVNGPRNTGLGRQILNATNAWADKNNKTIFLIPDASPDSKLGGLTQEQLKNWYGRNGFVQSGDAMIRKPQQLADESRTIEGEARIVSMGEAEQVKLLTQETDKLTEGQITRLEQHYKAKRGSDEFIGKVKEDVLKFVNIGAKAVAGAVRDIIRQISNGVMAIAIVFNPNLASDPIKIAVPTYETRTEQVIQKAPSEAAKNMSPAAQRAYEVIYPTIKDELGKTNKFFVITDKPTATQFIFNPDGTLLFQSKVLVAKSFGDFMKGDNNIDANKITPAGLMTLVQRTNTSSTKGYDFNTVYGVEGIENGQKYFTTLMHSVWLNEKDAQQRQQALKESGPENSRYSFGCINVDKDTFGKILNGHEEQMNGATLFVVPDNQENVMEFINGKATFEKDITRQGITPKTKTVTEKVATQTVAGIKGTQLAAKEENTEKLAKKGAQFFDELEDKVDSFAKVHSHLKDAGIENALDFVSDWVYTTGNAEDVNPGSIESIGGRYTVTINQNNNMSSGYVTETTLHEIGHAVDMAPHGGVYSAQPEMSVILKDGKVTAIGKVAKEMYNLFKTKENWGAYLDYPFATEYHPDLNTHVKIESELFAQMFAVYTTPKGKALMQQEAPISAAYMEEVINDIKSTKALQIQKAETVATRTTRFQNRPTAQRPQTGFSPIQRREEVGKLFREASSLGSIRAGAQARINALPPSYSGPLHTIFDTLEDVAKKGKIWASFTEDLAKVASKYIPSVTKYVSLMKERSAIKTKYERRVEEILQDYQKLSGEVKGTGKGSVNAFLKESTMSGKWGFQPDWIEDTVVVDDIMKSKFDDMPESAQKVITKVFEHGFNTLSDMKQAVTTNITTEYDALIKQAEDEGDLAEMAKLEKQKADALRDYRSLMAVQANSPYAPLKRFGNYVVAGKSQEYLDAEEAKDRKTIEKLQKDGDHYFVQFAETWAEAKAIARSQEGNYASVEPFEKDDAQRAMYGGKDVSDVFQRLRTLADSSLEEGSTKSKKAIDSLLVNLQLALLSEQSARQAENRRKGIAGAEDDMMRSFATQGRATAHFISTLHNTSAIYDELRSMQKQADASTPGRGERRRYYNEFLKRHSMGFNYQANPLLDKALGVTSMWMLLSSPAYYLQNATQPYMMSMPVIAGKHGWTKTFSAMTQGYKDIASVIRSEGLNEKTYAKLPADVREAIETLVNSGRIDISLEGDLGRWQSTEEKNIASIAIEKMRNISQDIESINRVVTAVAAYRLEKEKGASQEDAVKYADQIILDTHGDYSGFNAPRFTRQGVGRLMTQFRKFQLIQISLMAKLVNQAFKGASPEERFAGKKALAFTLGHTFAMAGVMGMPGFAAIAWIIGKAFGDEDEPDNPEATLRKIIGDDTLANLLLKGVPKLAGVDLSGKLGMGQMLSILPYADIDLTRDGYARAVTAAMGPFVGGLMPKVIDGVGLMAQGNYYKGLTALAPKGMADVIKATEMANKGIVQRNGDVVLSPDDIGTLDIISQALGLPTNTITDKQFIRGAEYEFKKFYDERTTELKSDYVKAFRSGDADSMKEIREKWEATQIARVRNGQKRQPLSELFMAPQQQIKREKEIKGGVVKPSLASGFVTER